MARRDGEPLVHEGVSELKPRARKARAMLVELIGASAYEPGQKLPGERELAALVGVSRTVLRDALNALEREWVIESSPWRGWFVATTTTTEQTTLRSFTEMALARGLVPGTRLVHQDVRPATHNEATALAIAPAAPVLDLVRVRTLDEVPTCIDSTVVALSRAPGLADLDFSTGSLYDALERAGVWVARSDYTVSAAGATPDEAAVLGLAAGAPVLVGEEVGHTATGSPIVLGRVVYRSEAYRFQASLYRGLGVGG